RRRGRGRGESPLAKVLRVHRQRPALAHALALGRIPAEVREGLPERLSPHDRSPEALQGRWIAGRRGRDGGVRGECPRRGSGRWKVRTITKTRKPRTRIARFRFFDFRVFVILFEIESWASQPDFSSFRASCRWPGSRWSAFTTGMSSTSTPTKRCSRRRPPAPWTP